jgi:hypothetical protein
MAGMSNFTEVALRKAMFRTTLVTVRANSTAYSVGDQVMLGTSDLSVYECITAGTSAGSPPAFNTGLGSSTTDGTVVFLTCKQGYPKRPIYIALFTSDPTDAASGTEVSGGSYARVQYDPSDANWSAPDATGGLCQNLAAITFPAPTGNWGVVTHFGVFDRSALGNLTAHGVLTTPKTVNSGDPAPTFPIGALSLTYA